VELDRLARDRADDADALSAYPQRRSHERREHPLRIGCPGIGRDVVDDLGVAGEDRSEDPDRRLVLEDGLRGGVGSAAVGPDRARRQPGSLLVDRAG
jgi:hypothetical protein